MADLGEGKEIILGAGEYTLQQLSEEQIRGVPIRSFRVEDGALTLVKPRERTQVGVGAVYDFATFFRGKILRVQGVGGSDLSLDGLSDVDLNLKLLPTEKISFVVKADVKLTLNPRAERGNIDEGASL